MQDEKFEAQIKATFEKYPSIGKDINERITFYMSKTEQKLVKNLEKPLKKWMNDTNQKASDLGEYKSFEKEFLKVLKEEIERKKKVDALFDNKSNLLWIWKATDYLAAQRCSTLRISGVQKQDFYSLAMGTMGDALISLIVQELSNENEIKELLKNAVNTLFEAFKKIKTP